jgi:hypothetical protein
MKTTYGANADAKACREVQVGGDGLPICLAGHPRYVVDGSIRFGHCAYRAPIIKSSNLGLLILWHVFAYDIWFSESRYTELKSRAELKRQRSRA